MARRKSRTILERQLEAREKLWPDVSSQMLWDRKVRDGFVAVPRLMPLMMSIMDDLSGKGFPVGRTYLRCGADSMTSYSNAQQAEESGNARRIGGSVRYERGRTA